MKDGRQSSVLEAWQRAHQLLAAGFTVEQPAELIQVRERWRAGLQHETAATSDARLAFAAWLVEHGKLSDW